MNKNILALLLGLVALPGKAQLSDLDRTIRIPVIFHLVYSDTSHTIRKDGYWECSLMLWHTFQKSAYIFSNLPVTILQRKMPGIQ